MFRISLKCGAALVLSIATQHILHMDVVDAARVAAVSDSLMLEEGGSSSTTQLEEETSSNTSAWLVLSNFLDDGCAYTDLLNAKATEKASDLPMHEAIAAGHLRKLSRPDLQKGRKVIVLESFESDSQPSSHVPEGLEGEIRETQYRGNNVIVKFPGGFAMVGPKNLNKLGILLPLVDVEFCQGMHAVLHASRPDYSLFSRVQWRDTSLAGRALDAEDENHITKYVGRFIWSDNVAKTVLNGILPAIPDQAQSLPSWVSKSLGPLTEEVLTFDVKFAKALNKLPAPSTTVSLWRGAWEVPATVQHLQSKPAGLAQSRFQSTTLAKSHACNFLGSRNEPLACRSPGGASGCVTSGDAFPVMYEIQTAHAKDVRKWNEKEQEFILIPNVPFDVKSVTKVPNDKFWSMSVKELASWLRTQGFPDVAKAVEDKGVSGADLVAGKDRAFYKYVDQLLDLYDPNLPSYKTGWPYEKHLALSKSMDHNRFLLQCASINIQNQTVDNQVPYYFHVVLQDAGGHSL
eukprot:TRINITY_DN39378_c0_g1_i1.p1 TRINITY_DN39378_c0_g1~~TRINITY_DN39378_c0_g1_i1.p1  ORF type:complete len:517 (+),score=69.58 TRINITY_DN39378_c0_g1_i1:60-1610(+)